MTSRYSFGLLAPACAFAGRSFGRQLVNKDEYERLLASVQRLRGESYLQDGAITAAELDANGRFALSDDRACWHFLLLDQGSEVIGCVRVRLHDNEVEFDDLRVRQAVLAQDREWGPRLRRAVERDLSGARENGLLFAEVGGWALAHPWRGTKAALDVLAGSYALGELWGGCLGVATATVRHSSSSMLRRMGGLSFEDNGEAVPPYYDPNYGCTMELIRFTRTPAQRFAPLISPLKRALSEVAVVSEGVMMPSFQRSRAAFSAEVA